MQILPTQASPARHPDGRHNPYCMAVRPALNVPVAPPQYSDAVAILSNFADRGSAFRWHTHRSDVPPSPVSCHSKFLQGACEFIPYPSCFDSSISSEDPLALAEALRQSQKLPQPLFVGQLRFETTAGELRWMLRHLAQADALKVEPRGPGCFVVVCGSEADADAVLRLNRRVLFDYHGVWVARTDAAALAVENRVAMLDSHVSRRTRLPRDAMVVERQRGTLNPLRQLRNRCLVETIGSPCITCDYQGSDLQLDVSSLSSLSGLTTSDFDSCYSGPL